MPSLQATFLKSQIQTQIRNEILPDFLYTFRDFENSSGARSVQLTQAEIESGCEDQEVIE